MKRSPLNPGPSRLKRTRLAARSKKHAAANEAARKARADYLEEHPLCETCVYAKHVALTTRIVRQAVEVNHIAGRNAKRCDLYEVRANYSATCRPCHNHATDEPVQTAGLVWAAKKFSDPEGACLETLRRLNPRRFRNVSE